MTCELLSLNGAMLVVWGKERTQADMNRVRDELEQVKTRTGHPVVYVSRAPEGVVPAPNEDLRGAWNSMMPAFAKCCSSHHVIVEGSGFMAAAKRAVIAGLLQARPATRKSFFVHTSAEEVLEALTGPERDAVQRLFAQAAQRGILHDDPASD